MKVITEEVFQGKRGRCTNCRKEIKTGDKTVVVREKRTNRVVARFCSHDCQNDKHASIVTVD